MENKIKWKKVIIKEFSIKHNMTIRQLAKKCNVHYTHLSRIFNGFPTSEQTAKKIKDSIK